MARCWDRDEHSDITAVEKGMMKRKEDSTDDNQALKDGRLPNDQPDSNVQQQPTTVHFMQSNESNQRTLSQDRHQPRKHTYTVETLTILVSYASRFTVRDATSLHFSRLFHRCPFTCADLEMEGAAAGVKVVDVTLAETSRHKRGTQGHAQSRYLVHMPLEELTTTSFLLNSNSAVYFMYRKYKCVFCLDFSSSMLACHGGGEGIPVDRLTDSLEVCLKGLLPSKGGAEEDWGVQIYVSVIAYCEVVVKVWSLLQGYLLHSSTLPEVIRHVRHEALAAETRFRQKLARLEAQKTREDVKVENNNPPLGPPLRSTVTHRVDQIAQKCGLALRFLPSDAAPLIVLLSDCVFQRPQGISYDDYFMQFCRNGTAVHGVQLVPAHDPFSHGISGDGGLKQQQPHDHHVNSSSNAFNAFGYVPDGDAVKHLCTVTGGVFFSSMDRLNHAISSASGSRILERPDKSPCRFRSQSSEDNACMERQIGCPLSPHFPTSEGDKSYCAVTRLSSKECPPLTVFQRCLLTFLSPLSQQSVLSLESPHLQQEYALLNMKGGKTSIMSHHKRWRSSDESPRGNVSRHNTSRPNIYSSLLHGDVGRYTSNVRYEHVLSYALGRIHLRRLLEIRCSEGFRIVDWSLNQVAENSSSLPRPCTPHRMDFSSCEGRGRWRMRRQRRNTERVRMAMAWNFGVRLDYLLDIQQLKYKETDYGSSSYSSSTTFGRSIDVVAAVNIEVTAGANFARKVSKLRGYRAGIGESPTALPAFTSGSRTAAGLLEFVATIKNVDMMLRQVFDLTLPDGSDAGSPLTLLYQIYSHPIGLLRAPKSTKRSWLGSLSCSEWHRCFIMEYIEVIFKSKQSSEDGEDRIVDNKECASSPSAQQNDTSPVLDDSHLSDLPIEQTAFIRPDSKEELLNFTCRTWSSMELTSGVFLKVLSSHNEEDKLRRNRCSYVHFALLRVAWPLSNVATLHLASFACDSKERLELVDSLSSAIWRADEYVTISSLREEGRYEESRKQQQSYERPPHTPRIPSFFPKNGSSNDNGLDDLLELKRNEMVSNSIRLGKESPPPHHHHHHHNNILLYTQRCREFEVPPTPIGKKTLFIHKINTNLHGCDTPIEFRLVLRHGIWKQSENMEEYIYNWFYRYASPSKLLLTYFHRFTCLWRFAVPPRNQSKVAQALIHVRRTDGFDDLSLCSNKHCSALLVREVSVILGVWKGESTNDEGEGYQTLQSTILSPPGNGRLLMQYRIFWIDNDTLCTELLVEPQVGVVYVPHSVEEEEEEERTGGRTASSKNGEWVTIDDFKRDIARYIYECDYAVLTAINTFETISKDGGIVRAAAVPKSESEVPDKDSPKWRENGKAENVFGGEQNEPHTLLRVSLPISLSRLLVYTSVNILPLQMFHMPFEEAQRHSPFNGYNGGCGYYSSRNLSSALPQFCITCFSHRAVGVDWGVRPLPEKVMGHRRSSSGGDGDNSHGRRGGGGGKEQMKDNICGHLASKDLYAMLIEGLSKLNEAELPLRLNFFEGGRRGDNTPSLCFHYEPLGFLSQDVAERGHWFYQPAPTCGGDTILLTFLPSFQDLLSQWQQNVMAQTLGRGNNSQCILCQGLYSAVDMEEDETKGMVRSTQSLASIVECYKTVTPNIPEKGNGCCGCPRFTSEVLLPVGWKLRKKYGWISEDGQLLRTYTKRFLPPTLGVFLCEVKASDFVTRYKFPVGELFSRMKRVLHRGSSPPTNACMPTNDKMPPPQHIKPQSLYFNNDNNQSAGPSSSTTESAFRRVPPNNSSSDKTTTINKTTLKALKNVSKLSNVVSRHVEYIRAVKQVHRLASANSMCNALRNGAPVCAGDFKRILAVCKELEAKLDVSILSSIKLKALRKGRWGLDGTGDEENAVDDFDQKFDALLADYFGAIKPETGYYVYWHGADFIVEANAAPGEKDYKLHLNESKYPDEEVMATENDSCSGSDVFSSSPPYPHIPLTTITATTTHPCCKMVDNSNTATPLHSSYVPEKVRYEIMPPILARFELRRVSKDGELIQCTQLSETNGFSEALLHTVVEGAHEDDRTVLYMFLSTFPGVTSAQTLSLQEELTSTILFNIDALTSDEILRSLLDVTPITLESLNLVKKCLDPLPSSELLQLCIPVHLVLLSKLDQRIESATYEANLVNIGRELLQCELLKGTCPITFQRVGDYFIAVEPYQDDAEGYKIPYWAILSLEDDHEDLDDVDDMSPKKGSKQPGYHAESNANTVTFHMRVIIYLSNLLPGAVNTLQEAISQSIFEAVKIVNRRLLLHTLHDMKYASELLIPPNCELDDNDSNNPVSSTSGDGTSRTGEEQQRPRSSSDVNLLVQQDNDLRPGCFSCSLKFRREFPLYHRISHQVLERLQTAVLEGFAITNRSMMYVYRDSNGSIFYLSLANEVVVASAAAAVGVGVQEKGENEKSVLVLSAYGVDEVGDDVAVHLTRVIEQKLAECSYNLLSSLLERNPKFHLTPLDLEVITSCGNSGRGLVAAVPCRDVGEDDNMAGSGGGGGGGGVGGTRRETAYLFLPKSIQDVQLFFLYLRQCMCSGELVNPLFTTKPETEMTEGDNNAVVIDHHHADNSKTDRDTRSSSPPVATKSTAGLQSTLPSMVKESENLLDIHNSNTTTTANTCLSPITPPPLDGGVLLNPVCFKFYMNLSDSNLSRLGPVTQRSARSIGKGIAIIYLSPINMEGKADWDPPCNATLALLMSSLVIWKTQCEAEIRDLKEEVLDPLNPGLIFSPDLCPLQATPSTSGGTGPDLDYESSSSSSSSTPNHRDTSSCNIEGQPRKSSPSFVNSGLSNRYGVRIEVDACGAIDIPNLLNVMERHINQALVDYWIERILLTSKVNNIYSVESRTDLSYLGKHPFDDENSASSDDMYLPEPQESNDEAICFHDDLPLLEQSSQPNSPSAHEVHKKPCSTKPVPCLGSSRDAAAGESQASDAFSRTQGQEVSANVKRGLVAPPPLSQPFPPTNARLCSSLGKLLHAGEHLGNPTVRRVSLCEALPDWTLPRVVNDCMVALSSCFQFPVDLSLLSFDVNGLCEVITSLDKQPMTMFSYPEQPKSFVGFLGLRFPNCEYVPSDLCHPGSSSFDGEFHVKSPTSSFRSSSTSTCTGVTDGPETSSALFPWSMEAEQVKESESLSLSIEEGSSSGDKRVVTLDEIFKQERIVMQRRILLVLHLSCRAQTLEVYNVHYVLAERICEVFFDVLNAAKLQKLALEHFVCQSAGQLSPFSSLNPQKCSGVGSYASISASEQHNVIKFPRLSSIKQTKKWNFRHFPSVDLKPEILKRIINCASDDSKAFSPKLWGGIPAERARTRVTRGGATATVPGSTASQLKSSTEGRNLTGDGLHKSIITAATVAARYRGHSRIAFSAGRGLGQVNNKPLMSSPHQSVETNSENDEGCTTGDSSSLDSVGFLLSPSLWGKSAWRRHVEHLMASMPSPLHSFYVIPDIITKDKLTITTTIPLVQSSLPVIRVAKHMDTLRRAVSEEEFEANSLSKMIPYTWEGLQTSRWKSKCSSTAASRGNKDQQEKGNSEDEETTVCKIPNSTVAESLAKHARLLGVMVFPLPTEADTVPLMKSSSFTEINSTVGGCPLKSNCDCKLRNSPQTPLSLNEISSGSREVPSLHGSGSNEYGEVRGVVDSSSLPQYKGGEHDGYVNDKDALNALISAGGTSYAGWFTSGLFDLLKKKWETRFPFRKLVLSPQVSGGEKDKQCAHDIRQYSLESMQSTTANGDEASSTYESSNFIAHFPTLRSVTKSSLNHIALGRAVFISPVALSSTLLLIDIQVVSNLNSKENLSGGGHLSEQQRQSSLAHCRLFSIDIIPRQNHHSMEGGGSSCCRGLDLLSTFSWSAPSSPLLPQIPTEISESRNILNLGDYLHDYLLESIRAKLLSSKYRTNYFNEGHLLLADLRVLVRLSKLAEEAGMNRMGCHFHIYHRKLNVSCCHVDGVSCELSSAKLMCYFKSSASQYRFQKIGKCLVTGGIARNHNGETCDHHIGGPESADIVAFALALPLSNENEKSSNSDKALDMFLIVKDPAISDLELVDSLVSFLQCILDVATRDFQRDLLWTRLIDAIQIESNIVVESNIVAGAGDEDGFQSCIVSDFNRSPSVKNMYELLELSVVEDIREWEPCIDKIFDVGLGTPWQDWFRSLQSSEDIRTVCWFGPLNIPKFSGSLGGPHLLCSFYRKWDDGALKWRSDLALSNGVLILVSLSTNDGSDSVAVQLVRRLEERFMCSEEIGCVSTFMNSMLSFAALGPACVAP